MTREHICNEYFNWLYNLVGGEKRPKQVSYRKLLRHLHDTEFRYVIAKDKNRAKDGEDLRYRFALARYYDVDPDYITDLLDDRACSVLEMMVALASRCEETMDDPGMGDRTGQWFWGMIVSLGLGSMTDDLYDDEYVGQVLDRFMDRQYEPNGKGGLFTIRNFDRDLRTVEIWYQLCWYLDSIT